MAFSLNSAGMACPSQAAIDGIKSRLIGILTRLGFDNPDIRVKPCQAPSSGLSMLVWSAGPKDSREGLARDAAAVPAEIKGATFGVFVTKNLLTQLAQAQFAKLPKSPTGYPNIHLTDLSRLGFTPGSPPAIETYINGYDVVGFPTPDVHFTTTVTDKLTARVDFGNTVHALDRSELRMPDELEN